MFYLKGVCYWIIQACFIVPPSSLCSSLFVFQRAVFKLGGVLSLNLYLSVDHRRFVSLCAVCGRMGGKEMLVAGRLWDWGRDPGLGDGICWNSREMRPQTGKFLILFSKLFCCWVRVPEDLGWKIILVHRGTFARLWCHLVWAGEESCWVTYGLVWILLHCSAWATTGFYHSPHAGIFSLPEYSSFAFLGRVRMKSGISSSHPLQSSSSPGSGTQFSGFSREIQQAAPLSSKQFKCFPWSVWRYQLEREGMKNLWGWASQADLQDRL